MERLPKVKVGRFFHSEGEHGLRRLIRSPLIASGAGALPFLSFWMASCNSTMVKKPGSSVSVGYSGVLWARTSSSSCVILLGPH